MTIRKLALVTGAGKRLGQAIAIYLAELGYDLIIHYNTSEQGALETKEKVAALGSVSHLIQADLAELYAAKEIISEIQAIFGRLDLLINCASTFAQPDRIVSEHSLERESEQEWEESLSVNARAPFFLIKHSASLLEKSPGGLVINILDETVLNLAVSRAAHTVSKNTLKIISELSAKTFKDKFRTCSLILGNILPGESMDSKEISKATWIGVEPVLEKIDEIIRFGKNAENYLVTMSPED